MSEFQYFNSPNTTFNVLKDNPGSPIFDNAANTATYEGYFEVRAVQFCSEWVRGRAKRVYLVGEVA